MWGQILGSTSQSSWGRDFLYFYVRGMERYAESRRREISSTMMVRDRTFRRIRMWKVGEISSEFLYAKWKRAWAGKKCILFAVFRSFEISKRATFHHATTMGGSRTYTTLFLSFLFFALHSGMGEDVLCVRKNIRVEESLVIGALWRKNAGEIVWENALPIPDV